VCPSRKKNGFPRATSALWRLCLHPCQSSKWLCFREISFLRNPDSHLGCMINQEGFCGKCRLPPCHPLQQRKKPWLWWPSVCNQDAQRWGVISTIAYTHTKSLLSASPKGQLHQGQLKPGTPTRVAQNPVESLTLITYRLIEVVTRWIIHSQTWGTPGNWWSWPLF
jgi:hypothetical protein